MSTGLIARARAPLRLGLAGGGTDVSPYCEDFGGAVLNATISLYAHATIEPRADGKVVFVANDLGATDELDLATSYPLDDGLVLHRALYNRIVRDYAGGEPLGMTLTTSVDCPRGSGLGASSALMVAMIEAFRVWLALPLGKYDIAHLAYEIERLDAGMAGGRQDQYAATFGGVNFIEFASKDRVIVNPLQLEPAVRNELEASILLYFTGVSRLSSDIIQNQVEAMKEGRSGSIDSLHRLKRDTLEMKTALLRGELDEIAEIINSSWAAKKATAAGISSAHIEQVYEAAMRAGARAGKISGAGGGGFMMLLIDPVTRHAVQTELDRMGGQSQACSFTDEGVKGWTVASRAKA